MANELRLRINNISGAINDSPLLSGAITINSPHFVDLPVIDSTNHLLITLDPLEVNGQAEIVSVISHASLATTVTVTRGVNGTTARQHALGTVWFHGPVVTDWNYTQRSALSTNRPTSPFNGELIYETDTNRWSARSSDGTWLPSPHNPPACRLSNNASQSIAHNNNIVVAFNTERYDTASMHDTVTANSRITIPIAGLYDVKFNGCLAIVADYTYVRAWLLLNGTIEIANQLYGNINSTDFNYEVAVSTTWKFAAGDFVEAVIRHKNTATAARNLLFQNANSPEFSATWIGVG